jgi:hypothetical protein
MIVSHASDTAAQLHSLPVVNAAGYIRSRFDWKCNRAGQTTHSRPVEAWEKARGVDSPLIPTGCFSRTGHKRYPLKSGASGERVATAGAGPTEIQPHMPDQIQPAERASCCGLDRGGR